MSDPYECPICGEEIDVDPWDEGECPECGNGYFWDEDCTENYDDCWDTLEWESYHDKD